VVYLFFINRYVIPLGFIVNLVGISIFQVSEHLVLKRRTAYNLEYWPDETFVT
jgi:hypothetical protein